MPCSPPPPGAGQCPPSTEPPSDADAAAVYEQTHVHKVYSQIAPHFSATRHKPWPLVSRFLLSQPPGSVGLDVGCGNGKYLSVNPDVYLVGSDRSAELVSLARNGSAPQQQQQQQADRGNVVAAFGGETREVMTADGLALPFREACADFVISVAVVHHFSTRERRIAGIAALLRCLRPGRRKADGAVDGGGQAMVYVWALEQASSRRGWDEGTDQDQLVPWVMKPQQTNKKKGQRTAEMGGEAAGKEEGERTYQRYYHLYRKGELEQDVEAAGGLVLESGYERDNWWVIAANAPP